MGLINAAVSLSKRLQGEKPLERHDSAKRSIVWPRRHYELSSWALWGFVATVVLTTLMSGSQGFGFTRMSLPHMLGTMFTPSRDRAKLVGFFFTWSTAGFFRSIYVAAFHLLDEATWWRGALTGLVHASFVLTPVCG